MKISLKIDMIKAYGVRILSQKGWVLFLQGSLFVAVMMLLLSRSNTLCVHFPLLLWLREDSCKVWGVAHIKLDGLENLSWWQRACWIENDWNTMDTKCYDLRLMGNWPVCFDAPYSPIRKGKPCIVYSFGIANDFRFDDALAYHNCTVYSFDPSMTASDHQRSKNVFFKRIGIGAEDNDNFIPRADGYATSSDRWKIMKLSTIMKTLGHTPESVTLVKMDVESNEWPILRNLMAENILEKLPQVLIEWHLFTDHPPRSQYKDIHQDYTRFRKLGFKKFWMRNEGSNHWLPKMETQAETAWLNFGYRLKKIMK